MSSSGCSSITNFQVDPSLSSQPSITRTTSDGQLQTLSIIRSCWGVTDFPSYIDNELKLNNGNLPFSGLEIMFSGLSEAQRTAAKAILVQNNLDFIGQIITDWPRNKYWAVEEHITQFKLSLEEILLFHRPILINCHAGRDHFSLEESKFFYRELLSIIQNNKTMHENQINVVFETHRGTAGLFSPWMTRELLPTLPQLFLTADLSHWILVSQRFFDFSVALDAEILNLVASRVLHIHSRYGSEQSPQINNPQNGRWAQQVSKMENYWGFFIETAGQLGRNLTVEAEFGPAESNYMAVTVEGNKPVVDQLELIRLGENRMRQLFLRAK
jgi:hypothetical protein